VDDPRGARALLRPSADDLFRLGTAEAVEEGRRAALSDVDDPPPPVHADAVALLAGWHDPDHSQESLGEALLSYLLARPDATRRECRPGHLTASTLVLDATGQHVLLTLHKRIGAWVVLGGHIEPEDDTVLAAATREAHEESGIAGLVLDPAPIYLGAHPVTCSLGIPTRHLDVVFLAVAPAGAQPVRSDESDDLAWFPVGALPRDIVPDLPALLARGLERMGRRS
jgi:8-oxo-dGTP pyrophosphatase MutT (NUDIX family)